MVPYFHVPVLFQVGGFTLYTFGAMFGLAIVVGLYLMPHRAKQSGLDPKIADNLVYLSVVAALFVGHLFHALFYDTTGRLAAEGPIYLLRIWDGMTSLGGIIGGLAASVIYLRFKKVSFLRYMDAYFYAFAFCWALARVGCTLVHDHPGQLSDFFLAVQYPCDPAQPDGAVCARHDLGFYELLSFAALSVFFYATRFKTRFVGFYILTWGLVMGPLRFATDFLRAGVEVGAAGDARYLGLTPAQLAIIPLFILSVVFYRRQKANGETFTPHPARAKGPGRDKGGESPPPVS